MRRILRRSLEKTAPWLCRPRYPSPSFTGRGLSLAEVIRIKSGGRTRRNQRRIGTTPTRSVAITGSSNASPGRGAYRPNIGAEDWHNQFRTLVETQRHTEVFDTREKDWVPRQETAVHLSTVTLSATDAAHAVHAHWGIKNHRDVTLDEEASCIRRNPGLFAVLRSFSLNLLCFNGVTHISLGLYDNALNFDRLLAYQGL